MDVLVIYESMYGNTHQVAEAIGDGLGAVGDVLVASVHDVEAHALEGCALLVVGGPTHVHGMSRPSSRTAAVAAAADDDDLVIEPDAAGPGLREFFGELRRGLTGQAAAFDTRIYTIGIGSDQAYLPVETLLGRQLVAQPLDLDEDTLSAIAQLTGGRFFRATDAEGLKKTYATIDALEKTEVETQEHMDYTELYPFLLWPALLLLLVELALAQTKLRKIP